MTSYLYCYCLLIQNQKPVGHESYFFVIIVNPSVSLQLIVYSVFASPNKSKYSRHVEESEKID